MPYEPFANIDVMSTPAYAGLVDIIALIGDFVTSPIWFGLSFLQLLVITCVAHFIIGICLGGIALRVTYSKPDLYDRFSYAQFRIIPEDNHPVVMNYDYTHNWLRKH